MIDRSPPPAASESFGAVRGTALISDPDIVFTYHFARVGGSMLVLLVALVLALLWSWLGGVLVAAIAGVVALHSVVRLRYRSDSQIFGVLVADATAVGAAMTLSGIPEIVMVAPYGYLLTASVLMLNARRAALFVSYVGVWVATILALQTVVDPMTLSDGQLWIITGTALLVYLGSTVLLSSVAAAAMRQRSQLDERLQVSREHLGAVVTGAPVALFAVDPAGILTLGEGRVLSALGMEPETVGRRMLEVDTIPARVRDIVSRSLEWGDPASTVVEVGGRALDLRITPRFGADDRFEGITGTATDITERIRAEDALRDKIEVEQLLLRISTDLAGLPAERVDRGVQGALGQIGAFVGSTRASVFIHDELHGSWSMAHEWVAPNATPHRDRLQGVPVTAYPWLWSRLVSGRIVHIPDVDNLPMEAWTTRDVWRDLGIATICMLPIIVSGRMAGFVSVDRETRLPFSDRDLMLLRIAAEMLVAALDRKLAHDRLAELVRSKDEFVASVSHELRTPLTTVVGLADELRDRPGGFDQEEAAQLHRLIAEEAGEVAAIVDDLLVVARADLGKVSLHTAYCDVAREVDTVLRVLPIESRQRVTVKSVDLSIWADPGRVRQIVRNLISNALRYGGSRIEIEVGTRHGVAAIEVSDDGDGVAPQEVERMFEPYHHTRLIAGGPSSIGLGLTVARKLARLMGGDVTYRRDRGWSVFTLTLPLADSAAT